MLISFIRFVQHRLFTCSRSVLSISDANETSAQAILREIDAKGGRVDVPLDLLLIGPDLVAAGHNEGQIVNALYALADRKHIELRSGNRVRVVKAL